MEELSAGNTPSPPTGPHLWEIQAVRDLLWVFGAGLLIWLLYLLKSIVLPIFTGFLLAYITHPLLRILKEKLRIPRVASIILIYLLVIVLFAGTGIWLAPLIKSQTSTLVENIPEYIQNLNEHYGFDLSDLTDQIKIPQADQGAPPMVVLAKNILGTTTDIILWFILVPIYFAFFAWHFQKILQEGRRFFQQGRHPRARKILLLMDEAVGTFLRARVLIALMVGVVYTVGWWLADVPYWFLLGGVTGILSIVPYLSVAGWMCALLLKYLDLVSGGGGFEFMAVLFWPSLVFGVGNFLELWVFTPWIHGRTTQLNPVIILTVVLIGGSLAGFWGLLLSIPIAICLNILFNELLRPRLAK